MALAGLRAGAVTDATDLTLPDPLTPPDCDLRDFGRIMIDITRLFGSTFNTRASRNPLAWMLGHKLWYRSWHQVPAASLPDDDDELCYLAELGFDRVTWDSVRELAMHGWVKCSDGRLYHPVVAEEALNAWARKLKKRFFTYCATIRKHNERHPEDRIETPKYEEWQELGFPGGVTHLSRVTKGGVSRPRHAKKASKGHGHGHGHGHGQDNLINTLKGGAAAARGARLPDDFVVPGEWIDWAVAKEGLVRADAEREAEAFPDYWRARPGREAVKLDWQATWRNWIRKAHKPAAPRGRNFTPAGQEYLGV